MAVQCRRRAVVVTVSWTRVPAASAFATPAPVTAASLRALRPSPAQTNIAGDVYGLVTEREEVLLVNK
nr:hypothetical protein CFP56_70600 [Quercus suber]